MMPFMNPGKASPLFCIIISHLPIYAMQGGMEKEALNLLFILYEMGLMIVFFLHF
jgi:hypothetical protein